MRTAGTGAPPHRRTEALTRTLLLCACAAVPAVPAVAQCPDGAPPPCRGAAVGGPNSVAVLLFRNVTRDTAYAYLSEGLSTEIATSLAGVPRLEVRSPGVVRSSQRHAEADPRLLGRRLGVRYVVEGDYQRSGERIRVTVRLVAVASGTQRWGNAYTRPMSDLLAVQEDVAREVATSIAGQLLPQERSVLASHGTTNPVAWDHFLRGNYQLARRTQAGMDRAIEEYTLAARLDPSFARAEAGVALAYALYYDWGWPTALSADSLLGRGLAAAHRAIARDSMNADGWMTRGYLASFRSTRDYTGPLRDFERAVALDPRNAEILHQYASKLQELNDAPRTIDLERRALDLDPERAISQWLISKAYASLHRPDEALHALDSALAIDPQFYTAYAYRGFLALDRGDVAGACRDADAAERTATAADAWGLVLRVGCQLARGDSAAAARGYAAMRAPYDSLAVVPAWPASALAWAAARLGRMDDALRWLSRARPDGGVLYGELVQSHYDFMRRDPRFLAFLDSVRPLGAK